MHKHVNTCIHAHIGKLTDTYLNYLYEWHKTEAAHSNAAHYKLNNVSSSWGHVCYLCSLNSQETAATMLQQRSLTCQTGFLAMAPVTAQENK